MKELKNRKKGIGIIFMVICLCIGGVFACTSHKVQTAEETSNEKKELIKPIIEEPEEDTEKNELDGIEIKDVKDISNILLIGCDARNTEEPSRSDSMMILSIDKIHGKLKLTSIMRDTYADIPEHGHQKLNHSFFFGGPELLIETIENNFKIDIDHYAIINFYGFKDLIDAMGGLEIDIKEDEISPLNDVISGTKKELDDIEGIEKEAIFIENAGKQTLNGLQTLAYARVRHVGNGDFDRMGRQRHIIELTMDKFKSTPITQYPKIITKFLPYIDTDMDFIDIVSYGYAVYNMDTFTPVQMQMPVNELSRGIILDKKGWVLIMDQRQNIQILHDFIYEDKEYDKTLVDDSNFEEVFETIVSKEKQN